MILLIHHSDEENKSSDLPFKFHYNSINSYQELFGSMATLTFKFHYDSINSQDME